MSGKTPDDAFDNLGPGKPSETGTGIAIGSIVVAIVAVIMCCGLPVLLLMPATGAAREAARRNGCLNNMRQLGLAAACHESSQKRFPAASLATADLLKAQTVGGHGDAPSASDDGFSWMYQLLNGIEETILKKKMLAKLAEDDTQTGPFDVDFVNDNGEHFAATQIGAFRCPSYAGPLTTRMGDVDAAVGNYCAIVGTDLEERSVAYWKATPNWENGGLPSACWSMPNSQSTALAVGSCDGKGLRLSEMKDGISKVLIAAESRETAINAWISGASMWVIAASPNALDADKVEIRRSKIDQFVAIMRGDEQVEDDSGAGLALNFGTDVLNAPQGDLYLLASQWATGLDRAWGPSSEHSGKVVIHVFADAHAQAIPAGIDATAYVRFITRSDGEHQANCSIE